MTTKILALTDALGNLVRFVLLPGHRFDTVGVEPLIDGITFGALIADKAFDSNHIIADLNERGAKIVISQHSRRTFPLPVDTEMYKWRHLIENFFCKLKEFKRIAMRADKTDQSFAALIHLAAAVINRTTQAFWTGDNGWYGNVRVVDSFKEITAADGGKFAVLTQGVVPDDTGAFTRFDGYRSDFVDGLTSEVKVYLNTNWASGEGFDYSVAANGTNGSYLRDFIFHVAQDSSTGDLLVGASNNTNFDPRQDLETLHHYEVPASGWFTLQHVFHDVGGHLSVDLNLIDASGRIVFTRRSRMRPTRSRWAATATAGSPTSTLPAASRSTSSRSPATCDLAGTLTEGSGPSHTVAGEIPFRDVDLSDIHTVAGRRRQWLCRPTGRRCRQRHDRRR